MAFPTDITRVSIALSGAGGNDGSHVPGLSADGRYVTFTSWASNLVSGDTNGKLDIFVHDRQTGITSRASVATGTHQAIDHSYGPDVSDNGRYVAFYTAASNLVSGDTNNWHDAFVHDRQTGITSRVSVATDGGQADNASYLPKLSSDGRYAVFISAASNLVAGDTNGKWDIFVHDQQTGQTNRVSVATDTSQANGLSSFPDISSDGRFVTFTSDATNLVAGDTNGKSDIFVHDRQSGETSRVSVATDGSQANGLSSFPDISSDGRFVTFTSDAANLVAGDTNNKSDIFVHDRQTGQTNRVSVATDGIEANGVSSDPGLSSDGRYVVFRSDASNLVAGDTNGRPDIFVHDRQTGQTSRVSVAADGSQANSGASDPSLSSDGRYVAFHSGATNLVTGDINGRDDAFIVSNPLFDYSGNDTLAGSYGMDHLSGLAGDDIISGFGGDDHLDGGEGNDRLRGGGDNDLLLGRAGADILSGNAGNDRLYGGADIDKLFGGTGDDALNGGSGDDSLDGGLGNDILRGDNGHDTLQGGNGNDSLSGGAGNDVLRGGRDDDRIFGGDGRDVLAGNSGDDLLRGGAGNDKLFGGTGADNLNGDAGNDRIDGGYHNDILRGGDGDDLLIGRAGDDVLSGGNGVDRFYGGSGNDKLFGGNGNDNLKGGSGADLLKGGAGADTFVFETVAGTDTVQDFEDGIDMIQFAGVFADLTIVAAGTSVDITSVDGGHMLLLDTAVADITEADFVFG